MITSIKDAKIFKGDRVLLRADFNVPISKGKIDNDYRIQKSLPTIELLRKAEAKIILVAHLENEEDDSLEPVFKYLKKLFPITFVPDFLLPEGREVLANMQPGDVVLLQNIRHYPGEKKNDPDFAAQLGGIADVYVNDAFSVSHRAHASIVGVPKLLPHYAGLLFMQEVEELSKVEHPPHPFLFILGGAKFSTKMPLVQKFLGIADIVFIGGALANDLFKAKGYEVGLSLVSDDAPDLSEILKNPKLMIPADVAVKNGDKTSVKMPNKVLPEDNMLDVGPQTIAELKEKIASAKCILWNGPLGAYEAGFKEPTHELAELIAASKAETIVGGGDTLAALEELGLFDKFSFVSTGGGAMLDFLANGTLPGIEALQ